MHTKNYTYTKLNYLKITIYIYIWRERERKGEREKREKGRERESDLALNNLQWLKCHKTQPNQTNQKPDKYGAVVRRQIGTEFKGYFSSFQQLFEIDISKGKRAAVLVKGYFILFYCALFYFIL